jgi:hypothetical protein
VVITFDNVDNRLSALPLTLRGAVLGIFAKEPRPGQVKTRLSPPLCPAEAAALYRVALQESVARLSRGPVRLVLCCAGRRAWFARRFPGVPLLAQGRGELGVRLARVTSLLFAAGAAPVAVAGSDSPDLPLPLVAAAFAALRTAEVAAIPCRDGGYALLALRRPVPELFADIPWSTGEVLAATRVRAAALGLRFAAIGGWDDLDDLAALQRLLARSPDCATARYARVHLGSRLWSGCG